MNEKLSILTELIKLAASDQELHEREYQFLQAIAKMIGVSNEQLDSLFDKLEEYTPPSSGTERILQFYRLVLLANVDLHVTSEEMQFMRNAGLKLGLNPSAIEEVFTEMKKNKQGMIPEKKLIEIFMKQYN